MVSWEERKGLCAGPPSERERGRLWILGDQAADGGLGCSFISS